MCNRYTSPDEAEIERSWAVGRKRPGRWWDRVVLPRGRGVFLRPAGRGHQAGQGHLPLELVAGQWALIPPFADAPKLKYSTNNARSEELQHKTSYRQAWMAGQRCIIPALSFDEPCWETGRNVWWRFERADARPWGLAGLWNTWTDRKTGEIHESYTMLTVNADGHPLMRRMHKLKPNLPVDQQDKRSVIAIELEDVEQWLQGTRQEARELLQAPDEGLCRAGPMQAAMGAQDALF